MGSLSIMPVASTAHGSTSVVLYTSSAGRATVASSTLSSPSKPVITNVTPEGLSAVLDWDPTPASDSVAQYQVRVVVAPGFHGSAPHGCLGARSVETPGSNSSALVSGLCAGVAYSASVVASNTAGSSAPSDPSILRPLKAQPPSTPVMSSAYARSGGLSISFSAPVLGGGDPLQGYTLTARGSG